MTMFVGGDNMLEDYEIKKPIDRKTDKKFAIVEFILILMIFQSAIMLIAGSQNSEAMQFRIVAHSNSVEDQLDKEAVYRAIQPLVQNVLETSQSDKEVVDNFSEVESVIIDRAKSIIQGQPVAFERKNALIPPKRSGIFIQPQAHYDAYVLTIGSGRGDNWWCSLFPNVCFPENEEKEEEEVTFFVWEWIKGLFA